MASPVAEDKARTQPRPVPRPRGEGDGAPSPDVPTGLPVNCVRMIPLAPLAPGPLMPGLVEITQAAPDMARRLADRMQASGASVRLVPAPSGEAAVTLFTEGLCQAPTATAYHARVLTAVQAMLPALAEGRTRTVFLQRTGEAAFAWHAGLPGLSRTLAREFPGHRSHTLSFHTGGAIPNPALATAAALAHHPDAPESARIDPDGTALVRDLQPVTRLALPSPHRLDATDTLLVTGGGQGVTAACAIALARRSGARFILVGRTRPVDWPASLPPDLDEPALRSALARADMAAGRRPEARAIAAHARALLASRSIRKTLSAIGAAGGHADYRVLDLADSVALPDELRRIETRHGALTGIIHGAGLLADRRFADMQTGHLATVFAPKVEGLHALLSACPPTRLRHLALFSSAAAHFGNPGQANYAMANEVLNSLARALKSSQPALNVRSFGWGPWDGGMVSDSLKAAFAERGIETIAQAEGAALFADLMLADLDAADIVIGAI